MIKAFKELVGIAIGEASTLFKNESNVFDTRRAEVIVNRIALPYEQIYRQNKLHRAQLEIAKEALKYFADSTSPVARVALQDIEALKLAEKL